MKCILCFPDGVGLHCTFFHGFVPAGTKDTDVDLSRLPISILAVQTLEQHPCLCPSDGSCVEYDIALVDHAAAEQCCLGRVSCTGGSVPAINAACEDAASGFAFSTVETYTGDKAKSVIRQVFPALEAAASDDAVIVIGEAKTHGEMRWLPLNCEKCSDGLTVHEMLAQADRSHKIDVTEEYTEHSTAFTESESPPAAGVASISKAAPQNEAGYSEDGEGCSHTQTTINCSGAKAVHSHNTAWISSKRSR